MSSGRVGDRYTLDRQIGRGGSGAVWLGRDEVLGRAVALKRVGMPPGSVDADIVRAEREARLAARVNHPNVVAVFDFVDTPDGHWLIMEYVAGTNLAQMIADGGPLTPDAAAPILAKVADALAAAHAATVVHRDVKPSNILVGDDGEVKLSDFGIARAVADLTLTRTGLVTGSPAYLAPEVASGRSATQASDVWSFGTTLFHALAGRPPYDVGDNLMGAMYRIVHEEPPRLPRAGWLAPLLEQTMERDPAARPSMEEVRDYLRTRGASPIGVRVAAAEPVAAAPDPTRTLVSPPPPPPPTSTPPPPPTTNGGARRGERRQRSRKGGIGVVPAAIGVAVVALLAVVGLLLLLGGNDDDTPVARDPESGATGQPSDSGSADPSSSTSPEGGPTADELEAFAENYVKTASKDPDEGFRLLTPAYQNASPAYADFWGSVKGPKILSISADPEALTVTYSYRYRFDGDERTETVTLQLVEQGGGLLISGASSG